MKRHLNSCALAALTLLNTQPAGARQADPVPSEQRVTVQGIKNASVWFKAESQHFVIYSDTSRDSVFQLLNNLERLDFLLRLYTSPYGKFQPRESKLTLYFHQRAGALAQFADTPPRDAVGRYSSCSAGVQGAGVLLAPIDALANAELAGWHTCAWQTSSKAPPRLAAWRRRAAIWPTPSAPTPPRPKPLTPSCAPNSIPARHRAQPP